MSRSSQHADNVGQTPQHGNEQRIIPVASMRGVAQDVVTVTGEPEEAGSGRRLSLGAVARFKGTFLLVALLVAVTGTVATWITYQPAYEAVASVYVLPTQEWVLYRPQGNQAPRREYLNSQAERVTMPEILNRVLANPDVQQTRWFRAPKRPLFGGLPADHERLRDAVDVSVRRGTTFIDIAVTLEAPHETAVIANAFHDVFLAYMRDETDAHSVRVAETLTPMGTRLDGEIEGQRRERENAIKELHAENVEQYLERHGTSLGEWKDRLKDVNFEIRMLREQLALLAGSAEEAAGAANQPEPQNGDQVWYQADAEWYQLNSDLIEARMRLDAARSRLGPQHPEVEELESRVSTYQRELLVRQRFLDQQRSRLPMPVDPDVDTGTGLFADAATLENQLQLRQLEANELGQRIEEADSQFSSGLERVLELERVNDELQTKKETQRAVRQRLDQIDIEGNLVSIQSGSRALPPTQPANRKRPFRFTAVAIFAGLALGFLAANLRGMRAPAAHEFSRLSGTPVLGLLPYAPEGRRRAPEQLVIQNESIRIVRTSVLNRLDPDRGHAILITSATPGEGKTTVALMLAESFAAAGKNVLLVDADLRSPQIAKRMKIAAQPGLTGLLAEQATDAEAIVVTDIPHLSVVPGSRVREGASAESLANGVMAGALKRWRAKYDLVLLDACPILPVADARILLRDTDGVILVAREGRSRSADLTDAVACVETSGRQLLGTVFVGSRDGRSYRSMYKHYCEGLETS